MSDRHWTKTKTSPAVRIQGMLLSNSLEIRLSDQQEAEYKRYMNLRIHVTGYLQGSPFPRATCENSLSHYIHAPIISLIQERREEWRTRAEQQA